MLLHLGFTSANLSCANTRQAVRGIYSPAGIKPWYPETHSLTPELAPELQLSGIRWGESRHLLQSLQPRTRPRGDAFPRERDSRLFTDSASPAAVILLTHGAQSAGIPGISTQEPVSRYFKREGEVLDPLTAVGMGHRLLGERRKVLLCPIKLHTDGFWGMLSQARASPSPKPGGISARSGLADICPQNFLFLSIFPEMAQPLQLKHPNQRLSTSLRLARDIPKDGGGFGYETKHLSYGANRMLAEPWQEKRVKDAQQNRPKLQ